MKGADFLMFEDEKSGMVTENKKAVAMRVTKFGDGSKTYEVINLLTRGFSEKHYLLPIPRVEIDRSLGAFYSKYWLLGFV